MRLPRNESKFYVRPIFSKKKSSSILLGSSRLYFSDIELIERKSKKIKKKIISVNEVDDLPKNVRSIVKEKLKTIKKPLPKAPGLILKNLASWES